MTEDTKYENIAVLPSVKERFNKRYQVAKKGKRHFYMSDYITSLLDLEESQAKSNV